MIIIVIIIIFIFFYRHDIAKILLKVALNTTKQANKHISLFTEKKFNTYVFRICIIYIDIQNTVF